MFVLNSGKGGSAGGSSQLRTNLLFFGKLGLTFGAIRLAYIFLNKGESSSSPSITQN
jgi:hypothetical protein